MDRLCPRARLLLGVVLAVVNKCGVEEAEKYHNKQRLAVGLDAPLWLADRRRALCVPVYTYLRYVHHKVRVHERQKLVP